VILVFAVHYVFTLKLLLSNTQTQIIVCNNTGKYCITVITNFSVGATDSHL